MLLWDPFLSLDSTAPQTLHTAPPAPRLRIIPLLTLTYILTIPTILFTGFSSFKFKAPPPHGPDSRTCSTTCRTTCRTTCHTSWRVPVPLWDASRTGRTSRGGRRRWSGLSTSTEARRRFHSIRQTDRNGLQPSSMILRSLGVLMNLEDWSLQGDEFLRRWISFQAKSTGVGHARWQMCKEAPSHAGSLGKHPCSRHGHAAQY